MKRAETPGTRGGESRSEQRPDLTEVVDAIPKPALITDRSGTVVTGNSELREIFDRDLATLQGKQLQSLFTGLNDDSVCVPETGEVTCRAVCADGHNPVVELACNRHQTGDREYIVCLVRDVTASQEREQTLEQYERMLKTVDDGIYMLDGSFTIESVNSAVETMTGYDEAELVGSHATKLASEPVIERAAELTQELLTGDRDVATLTAELETADGDSLPVETRFSLYSWPDGQYGQVGVIRDISDRRRFEQTLTALHASTRALLDARTSIDVARLVVEAALDVLESTSAAIYLYDHEDGLLRPAFADSNSDCSVEYPPIAAGDGRLWECFIEGEVLSVEASDYGVPDDGVCLPLGSYGVFAVGYDTVDRTDETAEVLDMLAASAEASLARVVREQSLWEHDEKLQERNRQLRRYKEVNTIIRQIDQVLVDADDRLEIEQAVCEQLATTSWVSFAWIGHNDQTELDPSAWAGGNPSYLDAVSLSTAGKDEDGPPSVQVARSDSMTVVPSVAKGVPGDQWRVEAISRDFQSVTSVPLRDGEFTYGVLTVYGNESSVFGEMLQSVFSELGTTIANAIRDVESRKRWSSPTAVEVELSVTAPDALLGQLADRIGSPVVCEGEAPGVDDTTDLFCRVNTEGLDRTAVCERGTELTRVASMTPVVSDQETTLFKAVITGETLIGALLDQGTRVDSIRAEPDSQGLTVVADLPAGVDVREQVRMLEERYDDTRLLARREHAVSARTGGEIQTTLRERLTDRQLQVLMTAYLSGFFGWPRDSSGKELAEKLDISQPTMSRHLRVGQRKLLDIVFRNG